jgi:hypothetical protein
VASIIVVAGNWQSINPVARFSGLVASLLAVYFAAEAGRRRFPSTATSLATLAACLTAPVGVAAAATVGQPWTVCTLVGGLAALTATEAQSRRWDVAPLKAATVVAFGLAAIGAAALSSIPAPVIVALGAVIALLLGSTRRSVTLAVTVGVAPLLVAVADAGFGAGTLARIGATGDVLAWSAPLSCAIAAFVIAVVAHRSQNAPLAAASLAVLGAGVLTSLVNRDAGAVVWFCLPAIALLAAEAAAAIRHESVWRQLGRSTWSPLGAVVAAAALVSPFVALVARWGTPPSDVASSHWYLPLALGSAALIASTAGSARRVGGAWSALAPLAASAAAFAALAMAGSPMWTLAVAVLIGWVAISVITPWSSWDATTATVATWVVGASFADEVNPGFWIVAAILAGICSVVACSVVRRNDAGFRAVSVAAVVALGTTLLVNRFVTSDWAPMHVGTLVFIGLIALGSAIRPERSSWPLAIAGYVTLAAATDAPRLDVGWFEALVVTLFAIAVAGSARSATSPRAHLAATAATIAGALALVAAGVDPGTCVVALIFVGIGCCGLATLDPRLVTGRTAGLVASAAAVVASGQASAVFSSMALAVVGGQVAVLGATTRHRWTILPGAALIGVATASLWWTTGTNQWVIDAIAPFGADGTDLVLAALAATLVLLGGLVRRSNSASSWLAYSPGLALAGTWLIATQLEPGTDWATFTALIVGVLALAVGGLRRLGAPLVLGTLIVGGTIVVSAGPRLAATPTWIWIAVGGAGLLLLAALIERTERPLLPMGRNDDDPQSVLEQFCEEFQ